MIRGFRLYIMHSCNPLHVYCRLRDIGISQKAGLRLCRCYERTVYRAVKVVLAAGTHAANLL